MKRKLLVAQIGVGSLTLAFCATFPGCNLQGIPAANAGCRDGGSVVVCSDGSAADRENGTAPGPEDGNADRD